MAASNLPAAIWQGDGAKRLHSNSMKLKARAPVVSVPVRDTAAEHSSGRPRLFEHELVAEAATTIRVRARHKLAVSVDRLETVYVVRSGLLALTAQIEGRRRNILGLYYPGEIFRSTFAPPLPDVVLTGLAVSEALRLPGSILDGLAGKDVSLARMVSHQIAQQASLMSLHAATISALSGEERVATFLVEQALRLGRRTTTGIAFDMPMIREDIADYLGLNADTLSRLMSRIKARGLITFAGRGHALTRDFAALGALSPITGVLTQVHGALP